MDKYICKICAHVYDPELGDEDNGVSPGVQFENLPTTWTCPVCGTTKDSYEKLSQEEVEKIRQDGFGKFL